MANPVVAPWELDPKGDVLLTLHNPNAPFAVWDEYWYRKIATEATHVRPIYKSNAKVQFLLSSRHLSLASGYFKNLLRGPWIEATPTSPDGRLCVDAEGWDENSMLILMRIIHGHNYKIPKSMTLEEVAKVAVLVDYYQCHEAVMVWSDVWINNMPGYDKHTFNRDIVLWILVTQVFRKEKLFKNATLVAIQHCKGKFPTLGLPITAAAGKYL
ncbi:hypothetical protein GL218_05109 [Daldinia childiae]|uniref:uncharacterized protein n=1 Tax=Daldinia childiae TaxID=326645 RepID=UPI001446BDD7|nr:uncharacterized protein GL218_05109 [Daldinia childiae]KAF3059544.1 hypothetical protein GL218_05109 [Daldinia childiae]